MNECLHMVDNWCIHQCVDMKERFNMSYKCLCAEGFSDLNGDGETCLPMNGELFELISSVRSMCARTGGSPLFCSMS